MRGVRQRGSTGRGRRRRVDGGPAARAALAARTV